MAKPLQLRPPFAWLGRHTASVSLLSVVVIGAFFRFFQLGSLPPGLYQGSALVGLQALDLIDHGWLPGLNAANGYAPLWVWLQACAVKLFGHTVVALQIWPAIVGTLAVLTAWLWLRSWFNLRIAWLGSFLLAVTPWAVTVSRNGTVAALFPLLVTLTLWTTTLAWRRPTLRTMLGAAAALTLDLLSGPLGWLLAASVLAIAVTVSVSDRRGFKFDPPRAAAAAMLAAGLGALAFLVGVSLPALRNLPHDTGLATSFTSIGTNLLRTLLMFNVFGDENWRHNLSATPMLNAFVGLMLVAGVLVSVSRLHERRYRLLFVITIVLLLPAVATPTGTAPNAARAIAAMPLIFAFCAIGISYMLELWYRTFPINSAARVTGQSAIIILLALTLYQGYTQYFLAWAGSNAVYVAYNEGAVQMAYHLRGLKDPNLQRYVLAPSDTQPVIAYLDHNQVGYTALAPADINNLPSAAAKRSFVIAAASRDEAVKNLKPKFPGGVLRPEYSVFNQVEIYYTYEVTK